MVSQDVYTQIRDLLSKVQPTRQWVTYDHHHHGQMLKDWTLHRYTQREMWAPAGGVIDPRTLPSRWTSTAPGLFLVVADILRGGGLLHDLSARRFEQLIAELLVHDGWKVELTQPSVDGGFDVVAVKDLGATGRVKALWEAKRYGSRRLVRLNQIRELGYVREKVEASKALIVTTSRLTRSALAEIQRDRFRLGAVDGGHLEDWVRRVVLGNRKAK